MSASSHGLGRGCVVTVRFTGLLAFMFHAFNTTRRPEVAPLGTVNTIELSLQKLIGVETPFKSTRLPLCDVPKFTPVICTWLPSDAVVADKVVMMGDGAAVELMETLSKVEVIELPLPASATPIYTLWAIVTVTAVPT
jgi:hypothetical protein